MSATDDKLRRLATRGKVSVTCEMAETAWESPHSWHVGVPEGSAF